MRPTLLRLALCLAIAHCGPTPIYPTGSTGGAGTCPEMAVRCGRMSDDACVWPRADGSPGDTTDVAECVGETTCARIPPPCWQCPAGRRLWRSDELAAWRASGVCPGLDNGVEPPRY